MSESVCCQQLLSQSHTSPTRCGTTCSAIVPVMILRVVAAVSRYKKENYCDAKSQLCAVCECQEGLVQQDLNVVHRCIRRSSGHTRFHPISIMMSLCPFTPHLDTRARCVWTLIRLSTRSQNQHHALGNLVFCFLLLLLLRQGAW